MKIRQPEDPLQGASDDLKDWMTTQPKVRRPWTLQMIVTGCDNPYETRPVGQPKKRSLTSDVSTGERVDTNDPAGQRRSQSIIRSLRDSGWSFEAIFTLVFHFQPKGTGWINDQWNPDFAFMRSWEQAGKPLKPLPKKEGEYHVSPFITAHVWAYIRKNPGKGTKAMRADWDVLLPGMGGRTRNGAIDRARESLIADGLIRIELQKFGKKALFSVVDNETGEIIEHAETTESLDRFIPITPSIRRVPFRRLTTVN